MTRRAILDGGRRVFAEYGYAGASMRALAAAAGVAVQTIYSTFGSKAGVLTALVDLLDEEAGVIELAMRMQETADPHEMLALSARTRRQIRERCGDIIRIMRSGAAVDAEVAAAWAEGMRRRRMGIGFMLQRLAALGVLKRDLAPERAADIVAALACDEVCDVLVEQRGWSFDDYEAWLRDALIAMLLDEGG